MEAKCLKVPFIEGLEKMDSEAFDLAMETEAAKAAVDVTGWPEAFPYTPACHLGVARSESHFAVQFHVRGLDLRAQALTDGGRTWEDSCCECFLLGAEGTEYYNFEVNCIGTVLGGKGCGRHDRTALPAADLARIKRFCTLPHQPLDESGVIRSWSVAMLIPFDLLGWKDGELPERMNGNFYKCGDCTAHPHFLSWNPVCTPHPDFHRPEYFGDLILG